MEQARGLHRGAQIVGPLFRCPITAAGCGVGLHLNVAAGAEGTAGASEHDAADGIIRRALGKFRQQRTHHRFRQRVQPFRAIEGHHRDAPFAAGQQFLGHEAFLS